MRSIAITGEALCLALSLTLPAQAQTGGANPAAEALFDEGRSLAAKGHFAEACPKFEASEQLDPGLGTLLNLAECYEKLGKTASAWAEYREAIPLARAAGSKVRQDLATQRAAALESRLSTLTIHAPSGAAAVEIHRDGVLVQPAELGSAIPVDPGPHKIEASAPGKQSWSSTIEVGSDASKLTVDVPVLAASDSKASAPTSVAPVAPVAPDAAVAAPAHSGSPQRITAVVVAAVGVVGLGLGTVFGLQAGSTWSRAKSECTLSYPTACGSNSVGSQSSAKSEATVSTVAFIAGGVALGIGAVLWLTADTGKKESVALGFGPGAAFLRGSFQ